MLELYKNLVLVFSSPSVFTLSWGKIITIIYLAHCQLRVFLLMDASCQAVDSYHPINWFEIWMKFSHYLDNLPCMVFIFQSFLSHSWQWTLLEHLRNEIINARNFLPSHCHVCFFKKHKACVVWLMHCDEHFGQEGDKLGVSSTKSVVDILPQRTSSREENTFFCVVDRWNSIFFTRYWSYFPLFINAMITEKASDKCNLEANYSMLFISTYKNCKIIPIQRQQVMMFLLR